MTARVLAAAFGSASFSAEQAKRAGVETHRLKTAARAGVLLRVRRGTYRVAAAPEGDDQPAVAGLTDAQRASVEDCVGQLRGAEMQVAIGGVTAAAVWELPLWGVGVPAAPVLWVPRSQLVRRGIQAGVRLVPCDLDPTRVVLGPGGLPITDPILSAIHVAARPRLSLAARLVVLDGGLRRLLEWSRAGITPLDSHTFADWTSDPGCRERLLAEGRDALSKADIRFAGRVAQALDVADPRLETALESISWAQFLIAGVELPVPQARVRGASGTLWRADFLFGTRVIGECDGAVKYRAGYTPWEEKRRQSDLEAAGFIVVRWTWEEIVYRPHTVLARIALALARAA